MGTVQHNFPRDSKMQGKGNFLFLTALLCLTWTGVRGDFVVKNCRAEEQNANVKNVAFTISEGLVDAEIEIGEDIPDTLNCVLKLLADGQVRSEVHQDSKCVAEDVISGNLAQEATSPGTCDESSMQKGKTEIKGVDLSPLGQNVGPGEGEVTMDVNTGDEVVLKVICDWEKD